MAIPFFQTICVMSYSPLRGVRRASGTSMPVLQDLDRRGVTYRLQCEQLTALTKQADPRLRLTFGLWAIDKAPAKELADLVPLEVMILQYARTLPAWDLMAEAPALNIIALDWPSADGYEVSIYIVGTDAPMEPDSLPFFYEARREEASPARQARMPLVSH